MNHPKKTILDEQLAGFILGELSEEEFREFRDLPDSARSNSLNELERIAGAVSLIDLDPRERIPAHLRIAVTESGRTLISQLPDSPKANLASKTKFPGGRMREAIAWLACLAASIIAIAVWQSPNPKTEQATTPVWTRESLIANATDLIQVPWTDGKTPLEQKVVGDIVWSNKLQRGFMRFVGMPVNDPTIEQYQLWIIDPSRDDEPIDGGVFDISTTGETIVSIQAKLQVNRPAAFAVTIEKPGGVVVSTQERLPLIATVATTKWVRFRMEPSELLYCKDPIALKSSRSCRSDLLMAQALIPFFYQTRR